MARTDYHPNRLEACKQAILSFIKSRLNHVTSNFALVTFGSKVKKVLDFANYVTPFEEALPDLTLGGRSALGDGVAMGIQILIGELRKVGAKVPRILIFSDGKYSETSIDPVKMAKLCKGLSIYIDTIRLGAVEHFNIMKRLAGMTDGQYSYCNDAQDMLRTSIKLAEEQTSREGFNKDAMSAGPLLEKIAGNLLKPAELSNDQKTMIDNFLGKNKEKCVICFQSEDPVSKTPFHISGRYCPNCHQPMHTHCAAMWAQNDEKSTDTTFRCPHCFYLLKIPKSVQKAKQLHDAMKASASATEQRERTFHVETLKARVYGDRALYNACPVCHMIFEEDEDVIACTNEECNAIYHVGCFHKLRESYCKSCGAKLVLH